MLKGKNILVGVTGSIAAYKAAMLVRLFVQNGAKVKVLMTPLAKEFITPLTLATLSKNPILVDFFDPENGNWNSHVDLGLWADAYVVAPATANTMGKMVHGIADNLLLTSYLSARCPVFIAPAMDLDMYQHPANQENIKKLQAFGNHLIEPDTGELASGLEGKGRMAEPESIVAQLVSYFNSKQPLKKKRILVTAGPTYERIDPVRFIGNYSSGKMGYAIAEALAANGAEVELVSGPVASSVKHPNITVRQVESAEQMHQVCLEIWKNNDVAGAILVAAVADFKPENQVGQKMKQQQKEFSLKLIPTIDIAADLGKHKGQRFVAGFALETENEIENAKKKIHSKNFDFIVLNSLQDEQAGFRHDTNKITIIDNKNDIVKFSLKTKNEVAKDIVSYLCNKFAYA